MYCVGRSAFKTLPLRPHHEAMKRRIRSLFCRCRKRARPRPRSLRDREQEQPPPGDPAPRRTAQAPGAAMRGPGHRRTALEEDQGGAGGDLPAQDPAGDGRVDPRVAAPPPEGPRQHRPAAHGLHGDREGNLAAAARGGAGVAPNRRGIVLCEGRRMATGIATATDHGPPAGYAFRTPHGRRGPLGGK